MLLRSLRKLFKGTLTGFLAALLLFSGSAFPAVAAGNNSTLPPLAEQGAQTSPSDTAATVVGESEQPQASTPGKREVNVTLRLGGNQAAVNGAPVILDAVPVAEQGVTLVPLRFVGEALTADVRWDSATNTITVKGADKTILLRPGEQQATVNGETVTLAVAPRAEQGHTLVPLRFLGEAMSAEVRYDPATKGITLRLTIVSKTPPVARFTFAGARVRPGDPVEVTEQSSHPEGVPIVNREWTGLQESYQHAGTYQVSLRVQDANGNWSKPFTQKLVVNTPPEPSFTTEKTSYRIGEPIIYRNTSRDADGHSLTFTWQGNDMAFFEPGEHEVSLTAKDVLGDMATVSVKVKVKDDVYYTKEQFYLLYGDVGDIIPYEEAVLEFPVINDDWEESERVLLRCNAPETIPTAGLLYRDTVTGPARLMLHHVNGSAANLKLWVMARNTGTEPVTITVTRQGVGGPSKGILQLGRTHLSRFFGVQTPRVITLQPGETHSLLPAVSATAIPPGECFTALADVELSAPIPVEFSFAALAAGADPLTEVPKLTPLPVNGHIRGTFPHADRVLTVDEQLGRQRQRLLLGDIEYDLPAEGIDALTGQTVQNQGNYGVYYRIELEKVSAQTAVLINARGGPFCGAVNLDGQTILGVPQEGILMAQKWAVILSRQQTGSPLAVEFSPPSGSPLPVNILFAPFPEKKGEVFNPADYIR